MPTIDTAAQFRGGAAPITYAIGNPVADDSTFEVVVEAGEAEVALREDDDTPETADYTTGTSFSVIATDANGVTAVKDFAIRSNRPPVAAADEVAEIGTQGEAELDIPGFTDENEDALTFSVESPGNVGATIGTNDDGDDIVTLTAMTSTWNADPADRGDEPVTVVITATDGGGLSVTSNLVVSVDSAPEVEEELAAGPHVTDADNTAKIIVNNLALFFKDLEDDDDHDADTTTDVVYTAASNGEAFVTASVDGSNNLTVTGINGGITATITVTATDSFGGTAEQSTSVRVNAS